MLAAAEGRRRGNSVYMGIKRLFCLFTLLKEPAQVSFVSMRHFSLTPTSAETAGNESFAVILTLTHLWVQIFLPDCRFIFYFGFTKL